MILVTLLEKIMYIAKKAVRPLKIQVVFYGKKNGKFWASMLEKFWDSMLESFKLVLVQERSSVEFFLADFFVAEVGNGCSSQTLLQS